MNQNKLHNENIITKNDINDKQAEKNLNKPNIVKEEKNISLKEKLKQNKLDNKESLIKNDNLLNNKENENEEKFINYLINT